MSEKTIEVRKIDDPDLIDEACALLYREYVESNHWIFSENNPSELRVFTKGNRKLLVDRITPHAVWFAAFDAEKIVGCIRAFKGDSNIPLEMETYPTAKEIVDRYVIIRKPNIYEASRACVDPNYKGENILAILYLALFEYCNKDKSAVFGSVSNGYVKALLRKIEFPCKQEDAFKFEETDKAPVNFYLATYEDKEMENVIVHLTALKKRRKKNEKISIFEALEVVAPIFPAPMYWHNTNGTVIGLNQRVLDDMGRNASDVLGKTPYDFYPKEEADHIWKNSQQVIQTGETLSQEEVASDSSGKYIGTYLAIKSPLYDDDGNVLGVLGTSIDITAKKEAEKALIMAKETAEAANKSKSQFIENMEHDIRTPLTGVIGILDLLAMKKIDSETTEILSECSDSVKSLLDYCDSILDFARQNFVELPILSKRIDIAEVVYKSILIEKTAARNKGITLEINKNENLPVVVLSDEHRIKTILINLISNAIKFTEKGKIVVSISQAKLINKRSAVIRFIVQDTGIGIPEDKQQVIFETFSKIEPSNHSFKNKPGLGLRMVKKFIEDLDGDINVTSKYGEGSIFTIDIPVKLPLVD